VEVYDDDDSTFDTEYAVDDYYQEYFEWVTEFSEGLAASGESGSGWFYPDPVKEPSGEPFYDEMDDPFYDPWEGDDGGGVLEVEHPFDLDYERQQRELAKHFYTLWLKEQKEKCDKERLIEHGLPLCGSHKAIARLMGFSVKKLRFLAFSRKTSHYIRFQIPKKTGAKRDISAPVPQLKQAQEWILENILEKLELHNAAHGFRCGRSIVTNAQPHVGAEAIINIDLKDFFPSISYKRVKGLFKSSGYSEAASIIFGLICTEPKVKEVEIDGKTNLLLSWTERRLPQGAPSSPAISNLLCHRLDKRLFQMAEKLGFVYTRYADDLTFSASSDSIGNIGKALKHTKSIVKHEGFEVNDKKTRVIHRSRQQEVTGVVVNSKLNVSREILRRFRATLYQIEKDGLRGKHWGQSNDILASLQGFANFVYMINPEKGAKFQEQVRRIKEQYEQKQDRVTTISKPINLSDLIALTEAELQRLGWNEKKRRRHLKKTYGKQSRQQLTDEELVEFLHYLKSLRTQF
jgi:retron-type reverse transcriptase